MLKEKKAQKGKESAHVTREMKSRWQFFNLAEKFYFMDQCHLTLSDCDSFFYLLDHCWALNILQGAVVVWETDRKWIITHVKVRC